MRQYRRSAHTVYELHYHFVFATKYRKPELRGEVAHRVRDLIREICRSQNVEILRGAVKADHVHLFVSVPPTVASSRLMQAREGKDVASSAVGISALEEGVLGAAPVGERILRV